MVELYECFTNCDYNKEVNSEKLQSYSNLIDLDRFKCESKAFVCYKLEQNNSNWNNCDELCRHFHKNNLKQLFPEVHKCLKLYLSIPATTATAERSFSCLKLLKTWLRSTTTNERLNDLGIIKMNNQKDNGFILNVDQVIDDFNSIPLNGRRIQLR